MRIIQVLFAPAEYEHLQADALADSVCVVFDILRATTTIITALAHGAAAVIPAADIPEALEAGRLRPGALLAGERDGVRIGAALTGGIEFDLGNSPREFTPKAVAGREIIITTTNGSRALKACSVAPACYAAGFLNLKATAAQAVKTPLQRILLVCAGTGSKSSYEDTLAAGAMADELLKAGEKFDLTDSSQIALRIYQSHSQNLMDAMRFARNGRRLLAMPALAADVETCLQRDIHTFTAPLRNGVISKDVS